MLSALIAQAVAGSPSPVPTGSAYLLKDIISPAISVAALGVSLYVLFSTRLFAKRCRILDRICFHIEEIKKASEQLLKDVENNLIGTIGDASFEGLHRSISRDFNSLGRRVTDLKALVPCRGDEIEKGYFAFHYGLTCHPYPVQSADHVIHPTAPHLDLIRSKSDDWHSFLRTTENDCNAWKIKFWKNKKNT